MELKKGMYVRYQYEEIVYIGKITFISEIMCGLDETLEIDIDNCIEPILKRNIIKEASNNIIDLIEEGDYVNGCYVEEVTKLYLGSGDYIRGVETSEPQSYGWDKAIPETWIKSIVTKEAFESISYRIGG